MISSEGALIHIVSHYSIIRASSFGEVCLLGYLRTSGICSQKGGLFNDKLSSETEINEYTMRSGGESWDHIHVVGDSDANIHNICFIDGQCYTDDKQLHQ